MTDPSFQLRFPLDAPAVVNAASDYTQRWQDGAHTWRHVSQGGFDRRHYEVAPIAEAEARRFVSTHHYSRAYPASRLRYGLYEHTGLLVGAAVLSVPVRAAVLTTPFPQLAPYRESLELGRFVLLDRVPANAESWFLGQLFRLAAADGIRGLVSFSDPVARCREDGSLIFPGHVGTIYQATNAYYLGRSRARTLSLRPDGTVVNERSLAKLASGERGHAYVARSIDGAQLRPLAHGGCHRYVFVLGQPAERRALARDLTRGSYPKHVDEVNA